MCMWKINPSISCIFNTLRITKFMDLKYSKDRDSRAGPPFYLDRSPAKYFLNCRNRNWSSSPMNKIRDYNPYISAGYPSSTKNLEVEDGINTDTAVDSTILCSHCLRKLAMSRNWYKWQLNWMYSQSIKLKECCLVCSKNYPGRNLNKLKCSYAHAALGCYSTPKAYPK